MANEKRLISLDEALKATHSELYWTESQQAAVRSFLIKQPKVDAVEVVHGRWIPSDIDIDEYEQCMSDTADFYDWECSVCHYQMSYVDPVQRRHLTNYCPNCGAKMDGDGNA